MPVETIRAYVLGIGWSAVGIYVNTFFNPRYPQINLPSSVVQLLLYPCGRLCQYVLPDWGFTLRGTRFSLNPGMLFQGPDADHNHVLGCQYHVCAMEHFDPELPVYYHKAWVSWGYDILLVFSTQCIGFGLAGLLRRFVVYPPKALWSSLLPTLALNRALPLPEEKRSINGWTISRYKFFFICFFAMFVYYWVPGYLFPVLLNFDCMSWISPNNFNLAMVSGNNIGLGLNPQGTFDWLIMR
jgi:OPT oligopeptide transporter protein